MIVSSVVSKLESTLDPTTFSPPDKVASDRSVAPITRSVPVIVSSVVSKLETTLEPITFNPPDSVASDIFVDPPTFKFFPIPTPPFT